VPSDADALLIRDGLIAAMGPEARLRGGMGSGVRIIDLRGGTVLPGFIDTHVHLAETGLLRQGVDVSPAGTVAEVLEILSQAFPRGLDPGFLRAHSLDPSLMKEQRYPTREELDLVSSQIPIFILRRDGHSCVVNSAFYQRCGLTVDVLGVEVDPHTAEPTGVLRAKGLERAKKCRNLLLRGENRSQAIRDACWQAARKGVTTVHAICARRGDVDLLAVLAPQLPVDVVPYLSDLEVEAVLSRGLSRIGGDLLADGSLSSHTAALSEPYADRPDHLGLLYFEDQQLIDFVEEAHRAGLQVAIHAIGDRAVEQVLCAYEAVLDRHPRQDHRHRIEHAEVLRPDQIERMAGRGIVLAVQPAFETFWGGPGGMYASRLGPERVQWTNSFRQLVDQGLVIAGGSDSYITPIDPLAGIAAAVNHPNPRHRLSPREAVQIFTANGAYLAFQERERGFLQAGMRADLVVLSSDPCQVPPEDIAEIRIDLVIKAGEIIVGQAACGQTGSNEEIRN
jgi:predicted amidohydrolase YtcJ